MSRIHIAGSGVYIASSGICISKSGILMLKGRYGIEKSGLKMRIAD